ncbi:MAG TPA: low affinity iron permease family protein [Allosphingosinicella sp.]|jgi:low affinity Fe/Cu permease
MAKAHGRFSELGCWFSGKVAEIAANPYAQIAVILFCVGWFAIGWSENALTAALSIIAITLTQMVLNTQYAREAEASRRDIALHAKLDELIIASKEARNEIAGVEELEVEEIEALKEGAVVTPLVRARRKAAGR